MKKIISVFAVAGIIAIMLPTSAGAAGNVIYSDSNRNIEIVYGEFAGYRFSGEDAPSQGEIADPSEIAAVKFYIRVETPIEDIAEPIVELGYNSDTTGWNTLEHDLDDGLIVTVDVEEPPAEDDFFDAGLITWSEEVTGNFSVEVLDANGEILGNPAIDDGNTNPEDTGGNDETTDNEETTDNDVETTPPEDTTTTTERVNSTQPHQTNAQTNKSDTEPQTSEQPRVPVSQSTQPRNVIPEKRDQPNAQTAAPNTATKATTTGRANIFTASAMVMLSAWAIISLKKKK